MEPRYEVWGVQAGGTEKVLLFTANSKVDAEDLMAELFSRPEYAREVEMREI